MKRKYILAVLVLLGLGVISTMAFTLGSGATSELPKVYSFDTTQTAAIITKITVKPFINADNIRIKVDLATLTDTNVYKVGFELYGAGNTLDLTGATVTIISGGVAGTHDLANGYVEIIHTASGTSGTVYIRIALSSIYTSTDNLLVSVAE
jgi:hypothetical protein